MSDAIDIKALRARLGWTQEQLAEHLGVDRSSVSRMETRQHASGPVRRLLVSLAAGLPNDPPPVSAAAKIPRLERAS